MIFFLQVIRRFSALLSASRRFSPLLTASLRFSPLFAASRRFSPLHTGSVVSLFFSVTRVAADPLISRKVFIFYQAWKKS